MGGNLYPARWRGLSHRLLINHMPNIERQLEKGLGGPEKPIDPDEIARQYAEKLRAEIIELKEKEIDPHLKNINPEELTYEDLMMYDKAKKYDLTEKECREYMNRMRKDSDQTRTQEMQARIEELKNKNERKEITDEQLQEGYKEIFQEEDRRRSGPVDSKEYQNNSRANFAAMLLSKTVDETDIKRHPESPMAK